MAFSTDDFSKVWASTSPLTPYEFSDSNYKQGWNFVGSTPPARQMWDFLQKQNDEKTQWLYSNKLSLSGGTMTGLIQYVNNGKVFAIGTTTTGNVDLGWNWENRDGAGLGLRSTDFSNPGEFILFARDSTNSCSFIGKPDGSLTWDNKDVERVNAKGTNYIRYESGLQICWGNFSVNNGEAHSSATYTFPVSFVNTSYTITVCGSWVTSTNEYFRVESKATTRFIYSIIAPSSNPHGWDWLAIGWWK